MVALPDFSTAFYTRNAQRYAEVSHSFLQSMYVRSSHPGLKGDWDLMQRVQELVPDGSRGLDAGCGAGARDVFMYLHRGYDIYGVDVVEEKRRRGPQAAPRDRREGLPCGPPLATAIPGRILRLRPVQRGHSAHHPCGCPGRDPAGVCPTAQPRRRTPGHVQGGQGYCERSTTRTTASTGLSKALPRGPGHRSSGESRADRGPCRRRQAGRHDVLHGHQGFRPLRILRDEGRIAAKPAPPECP